jgi:hypothetical protein
VSQLQKENYIQDKILEGEHQQLDFKFEISDSRKIARTLVAFSNTDGGTLLIGVKDNGRITGVRSDEEFYMVQAASDLYCKPEIRFESKRWIVSGKTILEIIVPKGQNCPYLAQTEPGKWQVYVRVKDENILASGVQLKVWKIKTSNRGILIDYSDKVKKLMGYFESHETVSVARFSRIAFLSKYDAENIIAHMIYFKLLEGIYSDQHFVYKLKKNRKENSGFE